MAKKSTNIVPTAFLNGEYECTLDDKGRILVPVALKKQLPQTAANSFMIVRGLENYLTIYTDLEWQKIMNNLAKLNPFVAKNKEFIRIYTSGATPVSLDGGGRMLLPKRLMDEIGLKKEVILKTSIDNIEVWDKKEYDKRYATKPANFEKMAEEVMAGMYNNSTP